MANYVKLFGTEIQKRRKKLGLSQEVLAEKADIHRTYVSDIENGKADLSLYIANKITKALNMKLSQVIAKVEEETGR